MDWRQKIPSIFAALCVRARACVWAHAHVCVCVCVCERERERERESLPWPHVLMIQHHLHLVNHPCLELCDSYQGDPILLPC